MARGIDVPQVDIVINYDVPIVSEDGFYEPDLANYLHRVGRTGRFGTDGIALTLYTPFDEKRVTDNYVNINQETLMKKIALEYGEIKEIKDI